MRNFYGNGCTRIRLSRYSDGVYGVGIILRSAEYLRGPDKGDSGEVELRGVGILDGKPLLLTRCDRCFYYSMHGWVGVSLGINKNSVKELRSP